MEELNCRTGALAIVVTAELPQDLGQVVEIDDSCSRWFGPPAPCGRCMSQGRSGASR
jgi:hypothetical protein